MTTKNIMAGFRKTGVSPFNPGAISVAAMGPSSVTDNGKHWFCSNVGVFCVVCRLKCSFIAPVLHILHLQLFLEIVESVNCIGFLWQGAVT